MVLTCQCRLGLLLIQMLTAGKMKKLSWTGSLKRVRGTTQPEMWCRLHLPLTTRRPWKLTEKCPRTPSFFHDVKRRRKRRRVTEEIHNHQTQRQMMWQKVAYVVNHLLIACSLYIC